MKKLGIEKVNHGTLISYNEQKSLKGGDGWGYTAPADATYVAPVPYDPYDPSQGNSDSGNVIYPPPNETIGDDWYQTRKELMDIYEVTGGYDPSPAYDWCINKLFGY